MCDPWWEETEWHRTWKGKFPDAWQEVIRHDPLGEKHIADVHTPHGLTIELQHSHLTPEERAAREKFYGNMLWVVDGSRLKHDLKRFLGQLSTFRALTTQVYATSFPEEAFPRSWLSCTAPVVFDFENAIKPSQESMHVARSLWCLLPGRVLGRAIVLQVSRESFVRWARDKAEPIPTRATMESVQRLFLMEQQVQVARLRAAEMALRRQRQRWRPQGSRRRFRF
jgi:hypothetical protein